MPGYTGTAKINKTVFLPGYVLARGWGEAILDIWQVVSIWLPDKEQGGICWAWGLQWLSTGPPSPLGSGVQCWGPMRFLGAHEDVFIFKKSEIKVECDPAWILLIFIPIQPQSNFELFFTGQSAQGLQKWYVTVLVSWGICSKVPQKVPT